MTEPTKKVDLFSLISERFEAEKSNRFIGEIVYQNEENSYFEQTKEIKTNKVTGTLLFLVQCVDGNEKRDGWRVEFVSPETRPQESSRYFKQELDARIFFEELERGDHYEAALAFARECFERAMKELGYK